MGKHDRRWHELGSFVTGVAKHQSLVTGSLFGCIFPFGSSGIHTLRNVGRLAGDDVGNEDPVSMKNVIVVHVADLAYRIANELDIIQFGLRSNLAADDDDVALGVGFAGDPAMRILREAGIEHRIGNCVANFIWVTFPDGFGRENVTTRHG
jgi:hypothetical protein